MSDFMGSQDTDSCTTWELVDPKVKMRRKKCPQGSILCSYLMSLFHMIYDFLLIFINLLMLKLSFAQTLLIYWVLRQLCKQRGLGFQWNESENFRQNHQIVHWNTEFTWFSKIIIAILSILSFLWDDRKVKGKAHSQIKSSKDVMTPFRYLVDILGGTFKTF